MHVSWSGHSRSSKKKKKEVLVQGGVSSVLISGIWGWENVSDADVVGMLGVWTLNS